MRKQVLTLRHGSLFSGIGGFDLAAAWMGWKNVFHCEIDPFCNRILQFYFPKAKGYEDIKKTDFTVHKGDIDILTGGFPCQPYSLAGKRLGKADERHLWPNMLSAIRQCRPKWVVAENVLGIISWNEGVVFEEVQTDLEAEGYQVQPYVLPAAGVDAPHRRDRVWFVAYRAGIRRGKKRGDGDGENKNAAVGTDISFSPERPCAITTAAHANHRQQPEQPECSTKEGRGASVSRPVAGDSNGPVSPGVRQLGAGASILQKDAAHPGSFGCDDGSDHRQTGSLQGDIGTAPEGQPQRKGRQRGAGKAGTTASHTNFEGLERKTGMRIQTAKRRKDEVHDGEPAGFDRSGDWEHFPQTQPAICFGDDGLPGQLDFNSIFENIPFPVKPITFSKWRTESIKAYGNAIVPQVALQIFKTIHELELKMRGTI